jgi:hypothetical protein
VAAVRVLPLLQQIKMEVMGHHHLFLVRQSLTLAVVVVATAEREGRVAVETVVALLLQLVGLPTQAVVVAAAHFLHISLVLQAALA